jgi:hypothetical protein
VVITSKIKHLTQSISNQIKKTPDLSSVRGHIAGKGHLIPVSGKTQAEKYVAGGIPDIGPA